MTRRSVVPSISEWTGARCGWPLGPTVAIAIMRASRQNATSSAAVICRSGNAIDSATDAVAVRVLRSMSAWSAPRPSGASGMRSPYGFVGVSASGIGARSFGPSGQSTLARSRS